MVAQQLVDAHGCRVTFVSHEPEAKRAGGIRHLRATVDFGAGEQTPTLARATVASLGRAQGFARALAQYTAADLLHRPDLVVGRGGLGTLTLVRDVWPDVPLAARFGGLARPAESDTDDEAPTPRERLLARAVNLPALLDLGEVTTASVSGPEQRASWPVLHRSRLEVIPDPIDLGFWRPLADQPPVLGAFELEPGQRLVSLVAPGRGSTGLDEMLDVAASITAERADVRVLIVRDGEDDRPTGRAGAERPDPARVHVCEPLAAHALVRLFNLAQVHVHLADDASRTRPLLEALGTQATVVATATARNEAVVEDGVNGFLVEPDDRDGITKRVVDLLDRPDDLVETGRAARERVARTHGLNLVLPQFVASFAQASGRPVEDFQPPALG